MPTVKKNMAAFRMNSCRKIFKRYRLFFYFCLLIIGIQIFLAYSFYNMNQDEIKKLEYLRKNIDQNLKLLTVVPAHPHQNGGNSQVQQDTNAGPKSLLKDDNRIAAGEVKNDPPQLTPIKPKDDSSLTHKCEIKSNEALSAISRAKSNSCKQQLADIACLSQAKTLIPTRLPRYCPLKGNHTYATYLGCYKDDQKDRDMENFNTDFRDDNSPQKCVDFCLRGSYLYAGVQYRKECWCGNSFGRYGTLPESSCKSLCPGNKTETCGGYNAQRIFSTGLPAKQSREANLVLRSGEVAHMKPVRIVFVLTVTGRAVRQIHRLIKTIYHKDHYYYIHVDSRQSYLYRELLKLEEILPNVRLARERMATIWGGASLLKAHFTFIKALLGMTDWSWDYYINLSESDYPIKNITSLTMFLQKYQGYTFLKSNGRETPTFIRKQGMDQTFYECDNHLWRLGHRDLPEGIRYDGGSDWVGLYRKFCEYAVTGSDTLLKGLIKMYDYTLLPVESFFHVLLQNSKFCDHWIDNNLHLTNWKRKQGCKCQYKHIVDWCGCSPNDMKQQDFDRVLRYSGKPTFFARKFEAIVNQEILNSIDSLLGILHQDTSGLNHYWQNDFHAEDNLDSRSDVVMTFGNSFIRRAIRMLMFTKGKNACVFSDFKLLETHVLYVADNFYRYLVKFSTSLNQHNTQSMLETQLSYGHQYKIVDPSGIIGRLQNIQIGTDFDPKELIFRNYAGFIGPKSELALSHIWGYGTEGVVTFAWIDPAGDVASYQDVTIGKESLIEVHKPRITTPLRPGVWMVKVLHVNRIAVEVKFLVLPFATINGASVTEEQVNKLHNGPSGPYTVENLNDFQEKLKVTNPEELKSKSVINGKKFGKDLLSWIDELTYQFWTAHDMCSQEDLGSKCPELNLCSETSWSSMSPDPKSEIKGLDKYGRIR